MIKVIAKQFIQPEKVELYLKLANDLVEKTNRLDEGCIEYGLYQDVRDPSGFAFVEKWESQELLDRHMSSAHFKEIVPKLSVCFSKTEDVALYQPA
jgi:quinol monooxygenase YgiN